MRNKPSKKSVEIDKEFIISEDESPIDATRTISIKPQEQRTQKISGRPIKAFLIGENVFSNTKEATNLYGQSRFGELVAGKIQYSISEALYLLEKKKMTLYAKKKKLDFKKFFTLAKDIDKKIQTKYFVFRDMRNRGYIVKTALKFGAEFRVYEKNVFPGEDHALWVLFPVHESQDLTWHEFSAKNRVAHSTKKHLLIGIVDDEADVTYYEIQWVKP